MGGGEGDCRVVELAAVVAVLGRFESKGVLGTFDVLEDGLARELKAISLGGLGLVLGGGSGLLRFHILKSNVYQIRRCFVKSQ